MPTEAFAIPGPGSRWRCGHCGNLTRFDVTRTRTVTEYWHFTMAGEPEVAETTVVAEEVASVMCRWCGASDRIEIVDRPTGAAPDEKDLGGTP